MIRRAQERDIDGVIKLLYQVNQVHADGRPDLFKSGGIKYTAEDLKEIFTDDERPVYVYTSDDANEEVLGYAFCVFHYTKETTSVIEHKSLFIDDICVDSTHRREHIGQKLYEYVTEIARAEKCYNITLHVWECNPGATRFYQQLGMKPLNTTMEQLL